MPEAEVPTQAIDLVRPLAGKDPSTLGAIKATMYAAEIAALQQPPAVSSAVSTKRPGQPARTRASTAGKPQAQIKQPPGIDEPNP